MLNYLWGFMILIGIIVGAFTGNMEAVGTASIQSAKEAVTLCITMLGVMAMWTGLMQTARASGIINALTQALGPLIRILFPRLPRDHIVNEYIASNMVANFLGLGWAATPMGLKAMEELAKLEENRRRGLLPGRAQKKGAASNEMCTFLIINISSLQLIPVNIIAYRSQYGSANPVGIVGAAIVATTVSTLVGMAFSRLMDSGTG